MPVNLICNKFGHRRVTVVGGLLMNTGFVLSTFAKELWVLYFTYGILIGRRRLFRYSLSYSVRYYVRYTVRYSLRSSVRYSVLPFAISYR